MDPIDRSQQYFDAIPIHPDFYIGESLSGYVVRVCIENYQDPLRFLMAILSGKDASRTRSKPDKSQFLADYLDIGKLESFDALSQVLGQPKSKLVDLTMRNLFTDKRNCVTTVDFQLRLQNNSLLNISSPFLRYCPECLDESNHFRLHWRIQNLRGCDKHGKYLLNNCWNCNEMIPLVYSANVFGACPFCGGLLKNGKANPLRGSDGYITWLRSQDIDFFLSDHGNVSFSVSKIDKLYEGGSLAEWADIEKSSLVDYLSIDENPLWSQDYFGSSLIRLNTYEGLSQRYVHHELNSSALSHGQTDGVFKECNRKYLLTLEGYCYRRSKELDRIAFSSWEELHIFQMWRGNRTISFDLLVQYRTYMALVDVINRQTHTQVGTKCVFDTIIWYIECINGLFEDQRNLSKRYTPSQRQRYDGMYKEYIENGRIYCKGSMLWFDLFIYRGAIRTEKILALQNKEEYDLYLQQLEIIRSYVAKFTLEPSLEPYKLFPYFVFGLEYKRLYHAEIISLLLTCFRDNSIAGVRDLAIISLAWALGLTLNEIESIDLSDLQYDEDNKLIVLFSQTIFSEPRRIKLGDIRVIQHITKWLKIRQPFGEGKLFCGLTNEGNIDNANLILEKSSYIKILSSRVASSPQNTQFSWGDSKWGDLHFTWLAEQYLGIDHMSVFDHIDSRSPSFECLICEDNINEKSCGVKIARLSCPTNPLSKITKIHDFRSLLKDNYYGPLDLYGS